MKTKKMLIIVAIFIAMTVPASVFAATTNAPIAKTVRGFFGIDTSTLTEKQKVDVTDYTKKMGDLKKEFVNKMVANGSMTKDQGIVATNKIDQAIKNGFTKRIKTEKK